MKKIQLADILEDWLKSQKFLKRHYGVYRFKDWNFDIHGGWPDELEDANAFIGMTCDGIGLGLAIMEDHVYYKKTDKGPRIKFLAADKNFFKKISRDLTIYHRQVYEERDCKKIV